MNGPYISVCRDFFLRLRFLASDRPYLSKTTYLREHLFAALITPRLDYCNSNIGGSNIPFTVSVKYGGIKLARLSPRRIISATFVATIFF